MNRHMRAIIEDELRSLPGQPPSTILIVSATRAITPEYLAKAESQNARLRRPLRWCYALAGLLFALVLLLLGWSP